MSSATSSDRKIRYSVVIVSYNARDNVRACLESLLLCSGAGDHEVIVVDNDSQDGTADLVASQGWLIPILNKTNNGFSKACNQGAAIAKGDFVVFLNPDTVVTRGWTDRMSRYFEDPTVGAVGPTSSYVAGRQKVEHYLPQGWEKIVNGAGRPAQEVAEDISRLLAQRQSGKGVTTKLLIGFCLMMRREMFLSMGGMDENLFLGNDDLDLSWRLREKNFKLVIASDAFVFHEGQKSFKTEKKSRVDRLVQESTDAMYRKLVDYYGGREKVPSAEELWDMGWFSPSPELLLTAEPRKEVGVMNTREQTAWKEISVLVYLGPAAQSADAQNARLERTLSTLPAPVPDAIVLNCAGFSGSVAGSIRKLDLGASCAPAKALQIALTLVPGSHVLFCAAGVEFSALFNHWLDKRDLNSLDEAMPLPLRIEGSETEGSAEGAAFLCRAEWLRDAVKSLAGAGEFFPALASKLELGGKTADSPWLLVNASDLPNRARSAAPAPAAQSWTPVSTAPRASEAFEAYPETLRDAMRAARGIAFAGEAAEMPPVKGSLRAFDVRGDLVPVEDQDLVILRVTPGMLDGLPERLFNLRRQARNLKRLMVVFNGNDARRAPLGPGEWLARPDLTSEGMTAALNRAGFQVKSEKPYHGFLAESAAPLRNWTLMEAAPRSSAHATDKLVSIIILGFNQVEYTKKCIESIRLHTRQKYELILVDNGSHDGTEAFFRSVPGAKVIRNAENLGVAKGWNQGMRLAAGEYLLILNNDIIVGPDWLENMVRLAESDAAIGMVGPRSNYIAGPQLVPQVPYKKLEDIQPFIRDWQKEHDLGCDEWGFIKGFSLLIPRRVFDKVGFFDERYGKGNFEDDDYCLRVRYHGFKLFMAHDSFIHHFGSVSFNQESVDWKALMIENRKKYEEKWARGAAAVNDTIVAAPAAVNDTIVAAPAAVNGPIGAAPTSPSRDVEEAQRAYERGDMAAARRLFLAAQSRSPSDPETYCGLGVVLFGEGALQDAAAMFLRCLELSPLHADAAQNLIDCLSAGDGRIDEGERAALARRFPGNPVFAAAAPPPKSDKTATDITSKTGWRKEIEAAILRKDFTAAINALEGKLRAGEERAACFNFFGVIAHQCGNVPLALEHFRQAVGIGPVDADMIFNLADTCVLLGRAEEALALLQNPPPMEKRETEAGEFSAMIEQIRHALAQGPVDTEKLITSRERNLEGEKLLRAGSAEAARAHFQAVTADAPGDFRALNNLGLAEWYLGDGEAAWKNFRACLSIRPAWTDALVNAFDCALALGRIEAMEPLLDRAQALDPMHREAGRMRTHIGREGQAIYANRGFEALEADAGILDGAEKSMKEGRQGEAILAYLDSMKRRPQNPQALNGLGIIAFKEKRYVDAYALFDAAAALHPLDQDILLNLWQGAQALKRESDVLPRLRTSLERDPSMQDVKLIVKEYA